MEIDSKDVATILKKLDEIERELSDMKLSMQETAGQAKGNQEITELKLKHMEETTKLREEKHEAQILLINEQVQLNKGSIAKLYDKDRKHDNIATKINILFAIIGILSMPIGYAVVQVILLWGKVKGF